MLVAIFAGQVIAGSSLSSTATVNVQFVALPLESVAVQVTTLVPVAKVLPLEGLQTSVAAPQLSVAMAANPTI